MGHPFPRIEAQFHYGLDRLLLEVNALVDLDPAIVPPLFHPGKKMASIDIYIRNPRKDWVKLDLSNNTVYE
jgi:hypothetical protein